MSSIKLFIFVLLCTLSPIAGVAQGAQVTEGTAKAAVYRIVQYSGLDPNFIVLENNEVKTAIAFIKNKKRYIEYNATFISSVVDSSQTNWAAISILAHELAHHLLGHTIDPGKLHPGDELACDKYSGFILRKMGASLEESLAAMKIAGTPHGTKTHPPAQARLDAIEAGWRGPDRLQAIEPSAELDMEKRFTHRIKFDGDENNYYVTDSSEVVWFNNLAEPIAFGEMIELKDHDFILEIKWNETSYFVDSRGTIWLRTSFQAVMQVGTLVQLN